ncbi:MAG: metallophosphoesterase, partial [Myxococcota bacterium]|nr:metallophosphoesterase [Myxococcota bacterium]
MRHVRVAGCLAGLFSVFLWSCSTNETVTEPSPELDQVEVLEEQDLEPELPPAELLDTVEDEAQSEDELPIDEDVLEQDDESELPDGVVEYELGEQVYTTLQQIRRPLPASVSTRQAISEGGLLLIDTDRFAEMGLGVEWAAGEPWQEQLEAALDFREEDLGEARSLLYLWQFADPQLTDEESPVRLEGFYAVPFASAYRPQSHLSLQLAESHVRTARRLSELSHRPFDLVLATGDFADNAQLNELRWFGAIMSGGVVQPDSGVDDDPIPGEGNDFNDPFLSRGIGLPWYAVLGNHDMLYMGFVDISEAMQNAAVGDEVIDLISSIIPWAGQPGTQNGYRDGASPDARVVVSGKTPADAQRRLLPRVEAMAELADLPGEPPGHGYSEDALSAGVGDYVLRPIAGKPLLLIALDTASFEPGFSEGRVTAIQLQWLRAQLAEAEERGELVIVHSHHGSTGIQPSGGV